MFPRRPFAVFLGSPVIPTLVLLVTLAFIVGCAGTLDRMREALCDARSDDRSTGHGNAHGVHLIVFVHGLCGDASSTWTGSTGFHLPTKLAEDGAFADSYILAFNYASLLNNHRTVAELANKLGNKIDETVLGSRFARISIVAHSMGGLLTREYVLRLHPHARHRLPVTTIIALATPNEGSDLTSLGQLFGARIGELANLDAANGFLKSLNLQWNLEFKAFDHPRVILVYAGYEGRPFPVLGRLVVTPTSATLYADRWLEFERDHLNIAKALDRDDDVYKWVRFSLLDAAGRYPTEYFKARFK